MRIGIYASPAVGGSGRFFRSLIETLVRLRGPYEYFVYLDEPLDPPLRATGARLHLRILPGESLSGWQRVHTELPRRLRRDRLDIFHAESRRLPVDSPCPTVLTVHDLVPLVSPQGTVAPAARRLQRHEMRLAVHTADHLVASSRYTRQGLIDLLHVPPRKITQISLGCSAAFRPTPRARAAQVVRRRFRVARPYLLALGPLIPRKNHPALIRAFHRRLWRQYDLVIAGTRGWWGAERTLRSISGDRSIHHVGIVTDTELRQLYAAAECLVYPAEEEGFGLPVIEAMACGTPVVAARSGSLPEVVGRAGLLVEPGSVQRLAETLEGLMRSPRLQETLRRRGVARARQFRWEATAAQTLVVYHQVIQSAVRHTPRTDAGRPPSGSVVADGR